MAHWSEHAKRLPIDTRKIEVLQELTSLDTEVPSVFLLQLPDTRGDNDAQSSQDSFATMADFFGRMHSQSVICVLATPTDAACFIPYLEKCLRFQLWVAVKVTGEALPVLPDALPRRHMALLIFTRYQASLEHTKTRIQYSYCPICGKTTKDYGGKKHTYHEYGTLMSDVWRDIAITPSEDIRPVTERLADFFGLPCYQMLHVVDLRKCIELQPTTTLRKLVNCSQNIDSNVFLESQLINNDCLTALTVYPKSLILPIISL